jgi:hypothetical protein
MSYPIFNSFVNQIENELKDKDLQLKTFRTWNEDRINAAGLEIIIDVSKQNNFIKEVCINFDWDRFREAVLARQLEGLGEHPILQKKNLRSVTVSPKIDIEMSWIFNEERSLIALPGTTQLDGTGKWMEAVSSQVNRLLAEDDIITRWHIEMEGGPDQKRLSAVSLISYFQYSLTHLKSLNEAHEFVKNRVHELMIKSKKVRYTSDNTLENVA